MAKTQRDARVRAEHIGRAILLLRGQRVILDAELAALYDVSVEMSLYVVRAFVQLRELLSSNAELARRLDELESKLEHHDDAITAILSAIRELMTPPPPKRRGIGFTADLEKMR